MSRRTKFKTGDLVIHSGSHYDGRTSDNDEWGIVMEADRSQQDFGRWRSVFVHWFGAQEQDWVSPRALYLVEDALEEIKDEIEWDVSGQEDSGLAACEVVKS